MRSFLLHPFHRLLNESLCSSLNCRLLEILQVLLHVPLHLVHFVGMSLTEALNGGTDAAEDGLEEPLVDNFGAHIFAERYLKPDEKPQLHQVVEWDDVENPANVHVSDCEAPIAHPVS